MSHPVRGMILGKFLPPHAGHQYLVEFAAAWCDELTVVVGTLAAEPVDGALRYQWMKELCPTATVVHLTDENPQHPSEHDDFWQIWERSLKRILPELPDLVFASEDYGQPLADVLGARFIPVDIGRTAVAVSGTAVRNDPLAHWDFLPPPVRAHYASRVSIFGPESTGKSTLAAALARHFRTQWVPEYARTFIEATGRAPTEPDMVAIAEGQRASESALARQCNRLLICDTDPLATVIWSNVLHGRPNADVTAIATDREYALTLLLDVDVPWVADRVRYCPDDRSDFLNQCRSELTAAGRSYTLISGDFDSRTRTAIEAVRRTLRFGALDGAARPGE
ncbi:MAG: HTH-type transcriptional repressor of NAD biosynthesis genes [Myxococcota bacterium]|jgi:HTH-type transcriptional repressor of NAD biosynthesis genes